MGTKNDRQAPVLNSLLAGALGDALGGAHEGAGAPADLDIPANLALSDDTQLTLATCEAMIRDRGVVDPSSIAASFATWFERGHITGIGSSTLGAVRDLASGAHWALAGAQGERAAGNGAAMRIAPVAYSVDPTTRAGQTLIWDVARITHRNDEACCGALAVAHAVRRGFTGEWQPGAPLLLPVADRLPDSNVRDRLRQLADAPTAALPELATAYGNSGYVVDSVGLALAAAERLATVPLQNALLTVVSCGGDTDTNASIAGHVLGCVRPSAETERVRGLRVADRSVTDVFGEFARVIAERSRA